MSIALNSDHMSEIEKYDKFILSETANNHNEYYEFDYVTPDEIKTLLNKFLKSSIYIFNYLGFSTEKLTGFIKEVCLEYSELLFFANKCINEIKELEIVKNALNERYKRYYKISNALETELSELKSDLRKGKIVVNDEFNDDKSLIIENKSRPENNYELQRLKEHVEVYEKTISLLKNKENQIYSDYQSFKTIFLKELRNQKFDLEEAIKQRDILRNVLVEFKGYFSNIISNQKFE